MSDGVNLARFEAELAGTAGLRSGAAGGPAYGDSGGGLEQLAQRALADATPLARDAATAYQEVMGDRRQRERANDRASRTPGGSTFL